MGITIPAFPWVASCTFQEKYDAVAASAAQRTLYSISYMHACIWEYNVTP